jgi:hypothetical protein
MSELELYFDRLQTRTKPFIPSTRQPDVTNWPKVEEHIRETLDEWTDCQGFKPTDKFTRTQWEAGTRDFVNAHGENPSLLRAAWEYYLDIEWERRQKIIVSTPRSLINFAYKVLEIEAEKKKNDADNPDVRRRKALSWVEDKEDVKGFYLDAEDFRD